jgi:hypothetical protein
MPVEVSGRLWGVIVVDSRHPQGIDGKAINRKPFRALLGTLSKALDAL